MDKSENEKTRLIAYGCDGKPVALIEFWLKYRRALKQQAVIIELNSKMVKI